MIRLYIKRLRASFGVLSSRELLLKDGLNIITGPNESGKSTWTAFIRAMFYGIDTTERASKGRIPDKTLYRPWSSAPMEGMMELSCSLGDITVERRTADARQPMRETRVFYTQTGTNLAGITGSSLGETLLGVSRSVFDRSAYIGRSGLAIDGDDQLESRVMSLSSSGDENISASSAEDVLKKQIRQLSSQVKGPRGVKVIELREIREQAETRARLAEEEQASAAAVNELEKRLSLARESLEAAKRAEELKKAAGIRTSLSNAEEQLKICRAQLVDLDRELVKNGRIPEEGELMSLKQAMAERQLLSEEAMSARAALAEAENEYSLARGELNRYPFFAGLKPMEALSRATEDAHALTAGGPQKTVTAISLIAAIFFAFSLVSSVLSNAGTVALIFAVLTAISAAVFAVSFIKGRRLENTLREKRARIYGRYGSDSPEHLTEFVKEYAAALGELENKQAALKERENALALARNALASKEETIKTLSEGLFDGLPDDSAVDALLARISERKALAEKTKNLTDKISDYSSFLEGVPEGPEAEDELPKPDPASLAGEVSRLEAELTAAIARRERATANINHIGSAEILALREAECLREIGDMEFKLQALELALDTLTDAASEMERRFAPAINHTTGRLFSAFTGGRYDEVLIERREFLPSARETSGAAYRAPTDISRGSSDQLYLALRLALCLNLFEVCDPPPIILDDALLTFDDYRLERALETLSELPNQVLVFSCHTREAELMRGRANIVNLTSKDNDI